MMWIKQKILNMVVGKLFNLIQEKDILKVVGSKIILNERTLSNVEKNVIITGARALMNNQALQLILREMKFVANKKIFFDSTGQTDLLGGKIALWTIDVLEKKIKNLSDLS